MVLNSQNKEKNFCLSDQFLLYCYRAPGIAVHTFHGNSKRERERALDRVRLRGGVLLTTYGMVVTSWEQLANKDGREFVWVS